jgi:thiamine-monophosphate kinase
MAGSVRDERLLWQVGEKAIISDVIRPFLNPSQDLNSVGDDCAVIELEGDFVVCASTDRVPADLISFKLGIIDFEGLGYYLAVLNLSDVAAMGGKAVGLLLNLAFPDSTRVCDLKDLLRGAKAACELYDTAVLGGDLSSGAELSLSATSIGLARKDRVLRRFGCSSGDLIYCTATLGLTSTAFAYFLRAKPRGLTLDLESEELFKNQFRCPRARFDVSRLMAAESLRMTAMDNTDGAGQTLKELAELNNVEFVIHPSSLPIHATTHKVAEFLDEDPIDLALGAGADFQLLGTIENSPRTDAATARCGVVIIGEVRAGSGVSQLTRSGETRKIHISGWDYFSGLEHDLTKDALKRRD